MCNEQIRVAIADDHAGVRAGIRGVLNRERDIEVVCEAADGEEAVQMSREFGPDVLLLDYHMRGMGGMGVLGALCIQACEVKVLVVSSYDDHQFITGVMGSGAQGYILKEEVWDLLADAIRKIVGGDEQWLSPRAAFSATAAPEQMKEMVSRSELEMLELLSGDQDEREIAERLRLEREQVRQFLALLMVKFGAEAVEHLRQLGKAILRG